MKKIWEAIKDWYYDVCDSFAFLAAVYAAATAVGMLVCKGLYKAWIVNPIVKALKD